MAKVNFSKLGLKKVDAVKKISVNGIEIEVKQYLPVEEKLQIITDVLTNSADSNSFANPVKVDVFTNLGIIYAYTNLAFTDKQKEDPAKLFDSLEENGVIDAVVNAMDEIEYGHLIEWIDETINSFYAHQNSALGILEAISTDYSNLNFDADALQKNIADPENLKLLKDIMTKLG